MSESAPPTPCAVCRTIRSRELFRTRDRLFVQTPRREFAVVACEACGHQWTEPALEFAEIGAYYPGDYEVYEAGRSLPPVRPPEAGMALRLRQLYSRLLWHSVFRRGPVKWAADVARLAFWPIRRHVQHLLPFHERPGRFLDVGCAVGHQLHPMVRAGWEAQGVEMDEGAAEIAQNRGLSVHQGDWFGFDPGGQTFEAISLSHVLEHFPDPRAVLRHAHDCVAPEGYLVMNIPQRSPLETRVWGLDWFAYEIPRHYHHFSEAGLRRLLPETGWEVVRVIHTTNVQNWIFSLAYRLESRGHPRYKPWLMNPPRWLMMGLKPLGWLQRLTRTSGRIRVYARPMAKEPGT